MTQIGTRTVNQAAGCWKNNICAPQASKIKLRMSRSMYMYLNFPISVQKKEQFLHKLRKGTIVFHTGINHTEST